MSNDPLTNNCAGGGEVAREGDRWRLTIPAGGDRRYRLAQIEDYTGLARGKFRAQPPRDLRLRARTSTGFAAGTWGFGLWNDPFGLTLGLDGRTPFRLPALPNASWFFFASPHNYLSFRDDKPAHGFLSQTFRAPGFHARLVPAAFAFPFSPRTTRRLLSRVVAEDGAAVSVDTADWHAYRLRWESDRVVFAVDEMVVLETATSPRAPLGLVIWIDNQYAAFTPQGRLAWGVLETERPAWLEIEDLQWGA